MGRLLFVHVTYLENSSSIEFFLGLFQKSLHNQKPVAKMGKRQCETCKLLVTIKQKYIFIHVQ